MTTTETRAKPELATVIRIYNTLTRRKEPLETIEPGTVRMYVCGVTPYDSAHIGHGMSLLSFDIIRRYLEHRGYRVRHIQNFTDIDDKIINRANDAGIDPDALTEHFIAEWNTESQALNVLPATHYPRATEEVGPIIEMVQGLIDNGHAYPVDGDVYFRVRAFPGYGKLSHRDLDDLLAGARIEVDERKDDPLDFALWKAAKPGEPSWPSPWGPGRPGWHIECSAMSSTYLGGQVDIHGGGADLIFPHHENEIAQSEAFLGVAPFARYWVHNGLVRVGTEKMSKSLGNFTRLKEIVERGLGPAFRLMILQSHYRVPLTYSEEGLLAAERGLDRLRAAAVPDELVPILDYDNSTPPVVNLIGMAQETDRIFHEAMDDDFNAPEALAAMFDLARQINRVRSGLYTKGAVDIPRAKLIELAGVLGLDLETDEMKAATSTYNDFLRKLGLDGVAEQIELARATRRAAESTNKKIVESIQVATEPALEAVQLVEALRADQMRSIEEASRQITNDLIGNLVELRSTLRASKEWQRADEIRKALASLGVVVEDSPTGSTWTWRKG